MISIQIVLNFLYSIGGIAFALLTVHAPIISARDLTKRQIRQRRKVFLCHGLVTYVIFFGSILRNSGIYELNQGIPFCIMTGAVIAAFLYREKIGKLLFYDAWIFLMDTWMRKCSYFILHTEVVRDDFFLNQIHAFHQLQSIYFLFWVVMYFLICWMEKNHKIKDFTGNRISCIACIIWMLVLTAILGKMKMTGMVLLFQGVVCLGCMLMLWLLVLIDALECEKERILYQEETQGEMKYYENVERNQQEVYRLYHDMKNHLISLQAQKDEEGKEYVRYFMQQMEGMESHADTGETYLDVLLQDKWKCAGQCDRGSRKGNRKSGRNCGKSRTQGGIVLH